MSLRKTVLVTGTSKGGLGDYIAQEFHNRGLRVFATARTPSKVQHLKDLGIEIILLEVKDSASIKNAAAQVSKLTDGKLDILVNNSGLGYLSPVLDTDLVEAKEIFNVNVWGVLEVTQAFAPLLIASKGTVVNNGSVVGRIPVPFQGVYNMSKSALEMLSKQMRVELSPFGVNVVHVMTGGIQTSFFAHLEQHEIPETSLYYPLKDTLRPWFNGEGQGTSQKSSPESYAKKVVANALSSSPSSIQCAGYGSVLTWLLSKYLWDNAYDVAFWVMGVPNLKKAVANANS